MRVSLKENRTLCPVQHHISRTIQTINAVLLYFYLNRSKHYNYRCSTVISSAYIISLFFFLHRGILYYVYVARIGHTDSQVRRRCVSLVLLYSYGVDIICIYLATLYGIMNVYTVDFDAPISYQWIGAGDYDYMTICHGCVNKSNTENEICRHIMYHLYNYIECYFLPMPNDGR